MVGLLLHVLVGFSSVTYASCVCDYSFEVPCSDGSKCYMDFKVGFLYLTYNRSPSINAECWSIMINTDQIPLLINRYQHNYFFSFALIAIGLWSRESCYTLYLALFLALYSALYCSVVTASEIALYCAAALYSALYLAQYCDGTRDCSIFCPISGSILCSIFRSISCSIFQHCGGIALYCAAALYLAQYRSLFLTLYSALYLALYSALYFALYFSVVMAAEIARTDQMRAAVVHTSVRGTAAGNNP